MRFVARCDACDMRVEIEYHGGGPCYVALCPCGGRFARTCEPLYPHDPEREYRLRIVPSQGFSLVGDIGVKPIA